MARLRNPHPGETIREEIEELGISAYRLAQSLGMQETAVSQILRGKRRITPRTALRLGEFFGTNPQFWLNLQAAYDLEEERRRGSEPSEERETEGLTRV
jgi:addiction module HigA family antidote